jgi:hypothetical protein
MSETSLVCPQKELFLTDQVHVGHGSLLIGGVDATRDLRTMYLNLARTPCPAGTPTGARLAAVHHALHGEERGREGLMSVAVVLRSENTIFYRAVSSGEYYPAIGAGGGDALWLGECVTRCVEITTERSSRR